jgi:hypothetical protein
VDREKLKYVLMTKKIPDYFYNLDGVGEIDQRVCLIYENSKWIVFFSERGKRFDLKEFVSEELACIDILERLAD